MPKLRVIIKPPPEPHGDAEQQTEALRDYLLQMSEELAYVLTHLEADNINDSTFERIQSMIPRPYTGLPVMDGDASSGQSEQWARGDHRHPTDTSRASDADLTAHTGNTSNPHSVTKAQVGLSNVENERQYSAQNPPPTPSAADVGAIPTTAKGTSGGVAELDANGHVPSSQLPSYVDDVKEYSSVTDFPIPGESDKIYIALDTDLFYRWGGTVYAPTNPSLALGETSSTAYRGDRGKTAYDHSQVTSGNPHNVSASDVGLGNVANERQYSAQNPPPLPTPADIGAATAQDLTDHTGDTNNPHSVTAAQVGLGNVDNVQQYSASNPPPVPDADDISYDNTQSGLTATNLQAAVDELAGGGGGGGPSPSDNNPVMDGTAAPGTSTLYSRGDHVHPTDTSRASASDLTSHTGNTSNPHSVTKSQVGLGNVDNVQQYSASNPPPYPVTSVNGSTGAVTVSVPSAYTSNPAMDSTASPGSSGAWAKGDHVHPTDTSRLPVYGLGKNLLDNACFLNPVNQRGQASYGSSQYGIDRWKTTGGSALTVNDGFVAASSTTSNQYWQQNIEQSRLIDGAQYTISVLIKAVTGTPYLRFQYDANPWTWFVSKQITGVGIFKETFTWNADAGYTGLLRAAIKLETGESASVVAMKLELGTEQTLAHQENGAWVLNEIPDYGEELRKCQRYFVRYSVSSAQKIADAEIQTATSASCLIFLPVTMIQTTPTVQIGTAIIYQGASNKGNASLSSATLYGNILALGVTATGMTPGSVGRLILMSSYLSVSCEL